MKRVTLGVGIALAGLGAVLSGCGGSHTASKAPVVKPQPATTPVPTPLLAFATYTDPILRTTLSEGNSLLGLMKRGLGKHSDLSLLGDQCALAGGDLSNSQTALKAGTPPAGATSTFNVAWQAYRLALAATDECGAAADASSRSELKTAANDLWRGLSQLSQAESTIARWQSSKV